MKARILSRALLVPALLIGVAACDDDNDPVAPAAPDIVETAVEAGTFETLVAAVQAAGLVETLQGDGPFTVFAPTDAAFEALPDGTIESLLLPENRDQLISILTYHVVAGQLLAEDVLAAPTLTTLQGQQLQVSLDGGTPKVNDSAIVATDIVASNGVIHVIDSVLLPQ